MEIPQPPSSSKLHVYEKAAVCSDKNICSNIGRYVNKEVYVFNILTYKIPFTFSDILQQQGNAIDSAIATLLCNGLVTMQSMGLGGGVIINYYNKKEKKALSIIGRERAPLNLNVEAFQNLQNASTLAKSSLTIAVPGELAAYYEAHSRYGSLPWSSLVQPTLDICYKGYKLTRHQRDALFLNEEMLRKDKILSKMFIDPVTSLFYKEGWHIVLPVEVCETYKLILKEGPLTFYNGSLASLVVEDLQEMDSLITKEDLQTFKAEVKDSLVVDFEPYYVYLPPPPASGHVVGFVMEILKYFKEEFSLKKNMESLEIHRIVEALKFGFVKRWLYDSEMDKEVNDFIQ